MKVLYDERIKVLAERNGWTLASTKGHIDGESSRRLGLAPSKYAQIGIDEYCLGFRAGYYERKIPESIRSEKPAAPVNWALNNSRIP